MYEIETLLKLQEQFSKLPGIGPKSAMRLAYKIIEMPEEEVKEFAEDMYRARLSVRYCPICGNLTDRDICPICADERRDKSVICVVRDFRDVAAFERLREYKGVYHVLGGTISPLDGIGPDDIAIKPLLERLKDSRVKEVIIATNPDVQGEATAVYLSRLINIPGLRITRIAHGVPVGGELEYTDEITLLKALEGRRDF
ncbi:MAG: recombination protein RecR [Christensenellaceae bacterium]|nr:recombination protein RecR [Christensenellaceae bacterium]